jgi:hypothetical protein
MMSEPLVKSKLNPIRTYSHYLVTLFNVRNFLDGTKDESEWLKWTIDRIQLFKTYCLPSIVAQTNQDFKWLLYFDSQTPTEILEGFKSTVQYANIHVILKSGYDDFYSTYVQDMINLTPENIDWIMQSRFDNDDIFHKDAIHHIQSNFKQKQEYIIALASGYTYQLESAYASHYYYPMSPFITLIENKTLPMKGIYYCNHWKWPNLRLWMYKELFILLGLKEEKVHYVLIPKLWIQMIHQSNMHNTADRGFPIFKTFELNGFNPSLSIKSSPFSRLYPHIHYVWWKRYFKSFVVSVLRRLFGKPD